jgi:L-malate glycosyltransferase
MKHRLKILFVASLESIHAERWIKYFIHIGHEVHVISVDSNNIRKEIEGSRVYNIRWNKKINIINEIIRFFSIRKKFKRIINKINPDLCHVHGISIYGYILKLVTNIPVVATAWGSEVLIDTKKSIKYRTIVSQTLKRVDLITCDAQHIKDRMVTLGANKNKISIIYFGTELDKFNPNKNNREYLISKGAMADCKLIISLRSLKNIYDVQTLIKATPIVIDNYPKIQIIIVGDGPGKNKLIKLSKELQIEDKILFCGRLSDDDLQTYTATSDIYVSTSTSDAGLASSTSEAMACGVPVIISDNCDNRNWIVEEKTGLLFETGNHEMLAEKINLLLTNSKLSASIADAGKALIENNNNWIVEMEKVNNIYNSLLHQ